MADFVVTDRRGQSRPEPSGSSHPGIVVPTRSLEMSRMARAYTEDPVVAEMRRNRRIGAIRKRGSGIISDTFSGGGQGGDLSFAMGRPRDPMFYWRQNNLPFDISKDEEMAKLREFCNTPEAPIWMGDYSFKPIGEVQAGDEVIGWEYRTGPTGAQRKKLVRTKVLAVNRRIAPEVVRITMESGKVIRCTPDHKWANPQYTPTSKPFPDKRSKTGNMITWKAPEYREAAVGRSLVRVIDPTPELESGKERYAAAWLSGGTDKVVSIESEGPGEVVSMQTETGNYVAWGFASKNCRLLYLTHPVLASCIDIYSKYPLQGMKIKCKDKQLQEFYEDLFFNQLKYKKFLVNLSREKWMVGEGFPLGTFNEVLGVWESEELLHPNDVFVERSPLSRDPRFLIRLPQALRDVLRNRAPVWEYNQLVQEYPELIAFAGENSRMPVSNMLLKQVKFEADTFHKRGIPIIMRAFRSVLQEEMLNTAMDAISDRLYTPLLLAKLGASASDLGTNVPWIPTGDELDDFRESLDEALAADFRVMVHNFATTIESVFGREEMPDLNGDFDRIEDRILQTFGLSRTMLQGAEAGETYAADALNRDVVTELMTDHQNDIKEFFDNRARIVAEAQEHFDYDVRNGKRYVKMEEVLEVDEESGEERIVEQPKLLVPELEFDTLNLSDQAQERQFIETLAASGVPITDERRILGTGIDFEEMLEAKKQEQIRKAVVEQETRRETYQALRDAGLPIPDDLRQDFEPRALNAPEPGQDMVIPTIGNQDVPTPALAPTEEDEADGEESDATDAGAQVLPLPVAAQAPEEGDTRPPESDEARASMPKPARKIAGYQYKRGQIRIAAKKHFIEPDNSIEDLRDPDTGEVIERRTQNYRPAGLYGDLKHVGMRRHVFVAPEERWKKKWDEEDDEAV